MGQGDRRRLDRTSAITHVVLAASCYLPLLATGRGRLAADTRQAIYLDPGRFVVDALSMWDPSRDLGTVTHQNVVLVWPMGVWFWLADVLGAPLWVAQRLWTASILFAAGAGVLFLARTLAWRRPSGSIGLGPAVAAFAYACSPYVIQYGTRTSVLLLPWAALPWLIGLTARALDARGWRHPALVALVVASIAVNATALALALLGPALWVGWSVWGARTVTRRQAAATVGRIAAMGIPTSAWWVVALLIEGRYGMPLLEFTETIDQVASTSAATEVLRGLGYWVPYLQQHTYPEVTAAATYLRNLPVLAIQLGLVATTLVTAAIVRWGHRTFFAALVVVGVVVGVGAYPPNDPAPLSSLFHDLARSGGVGLALRSTTRATPLALLGLACLLGAAIDAIAGRARRAGIAAGAVVLAVTVLLAPQVATRHLVDPLYDRPEELPAHWTDAIRAADEQAGDGRLLEIPGTRFAAYRWGTTYEPITAGLAETPTAWREQIPYGGAGSAELLVSLDNRLQEGRLDPPALAPLARLVGATLLVVRNDLAYERYDTIAPDRVWDLVTSGAPGLGDALPFGEVGRNEPDPAHARDDQPRPADPDRTYPPVALVPVEASRGIVTAAPLSSTVVLDGSGDGLIDAAGAGLLDGTDPVLYAGTTAADPELLDQVLDAGARVVLTDTNRRRVERWRSTRASRGITLRADEDPADQAGSFGGEAGLGALPSDPGWQTVAVPRGARVSASRYGNPLWFEAGVRPAAALDGDPTTAWSVGPTVGGVGDRLTVELDGPVRTDRVTVAATTFATHLTEIELRFDGGDAVPVRLDASSRTPEGQVVTFAERSFRTVEVTLTGAEPSVPGAPAEPIGIAELGITDERGQTIVVDEVVRLPVALVERLDERSLRQPLDVVLTRLRGDATNEALFEEERTILRELTLPTARSFTLAGLVSGQGLETDEAGPACRSDLVTVDGRPVPVTLSPAVAGRPAGTYVLAGCGPLPLAAGIHEVRTSEVGGLDVDQLVFASDAGGGPAAIGAGGTIERPGGSDALDLEWRERSRSAVDVTVPSHDEPVWLVLGQSHNDGWHAEVDGGPVLGAPVMVNGYANGFVLPAGVHGTVAVRWRPQRAMDASLLLATVGVSISLLLAAVGRRWRRASAGAHAVDAPVLDAPWTPRPPLPWPRTIGAAVSIGAAAVALVGPAAGPVAAGLAAVAGRWRRGHGLLALGAVAAVAGALGAVVLERAGSRELSPYDFFSTLHGPHRVAMLGVVLLGGELLLSRARPGVPVVDPVSSVRAWLRRHLDTLAPPEPVIAGAGVTEIRRRFALAVAAGVVPSLAVLGWLLTAGRWDLLRRRPGADFFDVQAHALLDGRLDVPRDVLGIEAFVVDGRAYMYQGPFPALLRLPVAALTNALDGRLAAVSMLVALAVAGAALGAIAWQLRQMLRGAARLGLGEAAVVAGLVLVGTGGSVLGFLGSQVSVYHESALWGGAMALAALAALLAHLRRPAVGSLVLVGALTTATLWSRASLGGGLVVATGLVAAGHLAAWWRRRSGKPEWALGAALRGTGPSSGRLLRAALGASLVPVVLYSSLNVAKLGTLVSVPWERQVFSEVSSARKEFLDRNDGSFFGLRFVPGTAVAYLRLDAATLEDRFPWVGFRDSTVGARQRQGALFDKADATGSLPVTHPLLGLLAAVGCGAVAVDLRRRGPHRWLLGPLLGAAAAAGTIFVFGFIAPRYLVDALPLLALAGTAGALRLAALADRWRPWRRRGAVAALALLGALGVWVTLGQAVWYQAVYASPGEPPTTERFFERRADLPALPFGDGPAVHQGPALPPAGPPGDLFVVGDCAALYVSDGGPRDELTRTTWKPVWRTAAVGAHDLDVVVERGDAGTAEPLLVAGTAAEPHVLALEHVGGDRIRFRYRGPGLEGTSEPLPARYGERRHLEVAADPGTGLLEVRLDGDQVLTWIYPSTEVPELGVNDLDGSTTRTFRGELRPRPSDDRLCREAVGSVAQGG